MRFRLVPTLLVAAVVAVAVFAAVTANPANSFPSRAQACTNCHPAALPPATVSATPSTTTPAAGATYIVSVNLAGLIASGDTGYWITDTPSVTGSGVNGGATGTNQTSYTQTMTAPSAPGTYTYTVWCNRGSQSSGQAKSTTYSITVPIPAPAISSLSPTSGLAGSSVTISGTNFGTSGAVSFSGTTATTTSWSATSIVATVPNITIGAKSVTVTSGAQTSGAVSFTVTAAPSGGDTTPPTTTASGAEDDDWYDHGVTIFLTATDNVGGSGVASITYSIDGGAPRTVSGSSATVTIGADADEDDVASAGDADGTHTIVYYATDAAGNLEAAHVLTVNIDTEKPSTEAPRSAKVRRNHMATLAYEIRDAAPNGGTAKATIAISNRRGDVVKVLSLGNKRVNTSLAATFTCSLRPGTYTFRVYATDLAGNTQANSAKNNLTVSSGS